MSRQETVYAIGSRGYFYTSRASNHPSIVLANQRNVHLDYIRCHQIFKGQSHFIDQEAQEFHKASRSLPAKSQMFKSQITNDSTNLNQDPQRRFQQMSLLAKQRRKQKTLIARSFQIGNQIYRVENPTQVQNQQIQNFKRVYQYEETNSLRIPQNFEDLQKFKSETLKKYEKQNQQKYQNQLRDIKDKMNDSRVENSYYLEESPKQSFEQIGYNLQSSRMTVNSEYNPQNFDQQHYQIKIQSTKGDQLKGRRQSQTLSNFVSDIKGKRQQIKNSIYQSPKLQSIKKSDLSELQKKYNSSTPNILKIDSSRTAKVEKERPTHNVYGLNIISSKNNLVVQKNNLSNNLLSNEENEKNTQKIVQKVINADPTNATKDNNLNLVTKLYDEKNLTVKYDEKIIKGSHEGDLKNKQQMDRKQMVNKCNQLNNKQNINQSQKQSNNQNERILNNQINQMVDQKLNSALNSSLNSSRANYQNYQSISNPQRVENRIGYSTDANLNSARGENSNINKNQPSTPYLTKTDYPNYSLNSSRTDSQSYSLNSSRVDSQKKQLSTPNIIKINHLNYSNNSYQSNSHQNNSLNNLSNIANPNSQVNNLNSSKVESQNIHKPQISNENIIKVENKQNSQNLRYQSNIQSLNQQKIQDKNIIKNQNSYPNIAKIENNNQKSQNLLIKTSDSSKLVQNSTTISPQQNHQPPSSIMNQQDKNKTNIIKISSAIYSNNQLPNGQLNRNTQIISYTDNKIITNDNKATHQNSKSVESQMSQNLSKNSHINSNINAHNPTSTNTIRSSPKIIKYEQKMQTVFEEPSEHYMNQEDQQISRLRAELAKRDRQLRQCKQALDCSEKKSTALQLQVKKLQTNNLTGVQKYGLNTYPSSSAYHTQKLGGQLRKELGGTIPALLYFTLFTVLLSKSALHN